MTIDSEKIANWGFLAVGLFVIWVVVKFVIDFRP